MIPPRRRIAGPAAAGLLVATAIGVNMSAQGLIVYTWLDWPLWARGLGIVAAAGVFRLLCGWRLAVVLFLSFALGVFFLRGPEPEYHVVPEFIEPGTGGATPPDGVQGASGTR